MRAHPLPEVRRYAELMLAELSKVIPSFLTRLDRPDRGGVWAEYLEERRERDGPSSSSRLFPADRGRARPSTAGVALVDFDPDGRGKGPRGDVLPPTPVRR